MGRLPALIARGVCLVALAACDDGDKAPAKSRVQAVLDESGGATPRPEPSVAPAPKAAASAKPRAELCADQLGQSPASFKPRARPERRASAGEELPADPLKRDERWTWINFWAAWCVPCKEELPLLLGWQSTLAEHARFVFVSLDDDERQLRAFLSEQPAAGLRSTYWLPDGATRQAWLDALGLDAEPELPLQLLLEPSGKLRCRVQGAVEAGDLSALKKIVGG